MIRAIDVRHSHAEPVDTVTLDYEGRFRRRVALVGDGGLEFLLDLPKVTDLRNGDHLVLEDGREVRVVAAKEPLLKVTADNPIHLVRLAWHIGNRHLPCPISDSQLLIRPDHVIRAMIEQLGGKVEEVSEPFLPEEGAYGHARTHSHEH